MNADRREKPIKRVMSAILILLMLFGCTAWAQEITPEQVNEWKAEYLKTNDPELAVDIGLYYIENVRIPDYEEAIGWFSPAAEQGNAHAQYCIGLCYYEGDGVEQNYEEAVKWYTLSAEQGYTEAQNNLGFCYYSGDGVEQTYIWKFVFVLHMEICFCFALEICFCFASPCAENQNKV